MDSKGFKRKLTAILCADVKGYARLMADDETATITTLQLYRKRLDASITNHGGRVVDTPGDYVLAEFPSVVEAVQAAVEIQQELRIENANLPSHRRMTFRIGINLGDVVEDEDKLYGEGLNIADRMQSLANGGEVCLSGTAYDQVKHRLPFGYRYLGKISVKNINEPVRVYVVVTDTDESPGARPRTSLSETWRQVCAVLTVLVIVIAAAAVLRATNPRPVPVLSSPLPGPERHDTLSIAVLPFTNMCDDKKCEFICDGITAGVTTSLSKLPQLFVIASDSAFTYKGKAVTAQQIGRELGVRYLLKGGIQRSGNRLRISARLVDATQGNQIWAEHYDREMTELFALQDGIVLKILTALQVKLTEGEQARIHGRGTKNLGAYLKVSLGRRHVLQLDKEGNAIVRQLAREAITLDPNYSMTYWLLAATHVVDLWLGEMPNPQHSLRTAEALVRKALVLDRDLSDAHGLLSHILTLQRDHDGALIEAETAVSLNPNSADALLFSGVALNYAGGHREAIEMFEKAMRLNPFPQQLYYLRLGVAYRDAGCYEEAITMARKAIHYGADNVYSYTCLASSYSLLGRHDEARAAAREILNLNTGFSLDYFSRTLPYKKRSDLRRVIDALRKAGLG